jgi:hypothetical protein
MFQWQCTRAQGEILESCVFEEFLLHDKSSSNPAKIQNTHDLTGSDQKVTPMVREGNQCPLNSSNFKYIISTYAGCPKIRINSCVMLEKSEK